MEARLAEGEPGLRGSRRGVFDPFHWARRDAEHARLPLSVTATAVTPSPPGKAFLLHALGRGSPTVAPLRVTLCAPSWSREAATSCGGRRRLLLLPRPCTIAESRTVPALFLHANRQAVARPTGPPPRAQRGRPTGAARPPADDGHNTQGVPSRPREEANSLAPHEAPPSTQARRGPGAAMVLARFGCHRSPFGSFPREGKNASHARATGKRPSRHQAQPKAHQPARNEGGPPVPPGRQRTTGITPKVAPSRPREEGISLAPHAVPPSSQARRGPGAAMVLSRIGCHRAPFGSFPREGKNSLPHPQMCKGTSPPRQEKEHPSPAPRAKGSRPPHLEKRSRPPPQAKAPRAGSGAPPPAQPPPGIEIPRLPAGVRALPAQPPAAAVDDILFISLPPMQSKARRLSPGFVCNTSLMRFSHLPSAD